MLSCEILVYCTQSPVSGTPHPHHLSLILDRKYPLSVYLSYLCMHVSLFTGGGMMRGGGSMGMMRGRGGMSRGGIRGGRGGMMRGGASGVPPETLYEDVYEPVPQGFSSGGGSYENGGGGSNNQNASSYFDEFPEPSADASMLGANYRHTQGKLVRMSNHTPTAASGSAASPISQPLKAL